MASLRRLVISCCVDFLSKNQDTSSGGRLDAAQDAIAEIFFEMEEVRYAKSSTMEENTSDMIVRVGVAANIAGTNK